MSSRAASPSASSRRVSLSPAWGMRGGSHASGHHRRGSTLPLVLALLALLGTVATALVYTSRLEAQAATNAGQTVKARAASTGGLAFAMARLPSQFGTPTNPAYAFATEPTWLAVTAAGDLSACINLNEVAPYGASATSSTRTTSQTNPTAVSMSAVRGPDSRAAAAPSAVHAPTAGVAAGTPAAHAQTAGVAAASSAVHPKTTGVAVATPMTRGQSAAATAAAAKLAKSPVGAPTPTPVSTTAPALFANGHAYALPASVLERFLAARLTAANLPADPASLSHAILAARDAMPEGRFSRTAELLDHVPGLTPPIYRALAPYLSTASSSLEVWRDPDGNGFVPVAVNTASPDEILATLRTLYPNADLHLLRQFTANIVDRRSADSFPTVFDDEPGALPIMGYKQTVEISEVVPDVATPSDMGDRGEYIEIHNPLSVAVDLTGWRLSWAGGAAPLDGSLAAGAYLIVTDDINGSHDPNPQSHPYGMGSFYDVFHVLPTGLNRIAEVAGMDLPDDSGVVTLYDPANHMIDYLSYAGGTFNGLNRGFEKTAPFCRVGRSINAATPFSETPYVPANDYETYCWQQFLAGINRPYACETDLLYIPAAYVLPGAMAPATQDNFPLLAVGQGARPDLRLADAFTVGDVKPAFDANGALVPCLVADASLSASGLSPRNAPVAAASGQAALHGSSANAVQTAGKSAVARSASSRAASPTRLAVSATNPPRTVGGAPSRNAASTPAPSSANAASSAKPFVAAELAAPRYSQGKVNLNTAPPDILAALPGLDSDLAAILARARAAEWQDSHGATGAFDSFAAFADHPTIWADCTPRQRLDILRELRPYVTLNSASFLVSSTNRREPLGPDEKAAMRVTSLARVELGEGAKASVVEWNFVKP